MSFSSIVTNHTTKWHGWRATMGSNVHAMALFRMTLGGLLLSELLLRFRFLHPFYSDEGTLPTRLLLPKIDTLYRVICSIHLYSGSLFYQQCLLLVQTGLALMFLIGYQTPIVTVACWYLYLSLTLRNTWLNFILDRYFHYLLFYGMFLPLDRVWSVDSWRKRQTKKYDETHAMFVSVAMAALKLQILWIYLDAGFGKYMDPLKGWTLSAHPLPALDAYARHTVAAQYLYALLRPAGLRLLTPTVVYVELLAAPLAFLGSFLGNRTMVWTAVGVACSLHIGIAFTLRNTVLLSLVACCAWCVFLPPMSIEKGCDGGSIATSNSSLTCDATTMSSEKDKSKQDPFVVRQKPVLSPILIASFVAGSVWFETMSDECNQSMKHIWSTLLHNRWNVFVGAEEYVTWEIAPGRLADGSVVDVWGRKNNVDWSMPRTGAPCTSTSRPGRWRSFPYLAGLQGEEAEALWGYLCQQWNSENGVTDDDNPGRELLRYNFFMLQADVLPDMGFSATRKRLLHSHSCRKTLPTQVGRLPLSPNRKIGEL